MAGLLRSEPPLLLGKSPSSPGKLGTKGNDIDSSNLLLLFPLAFGLDLRSLDPDLRSLAMSKERSLIGARSVDLDLINLMESNDPLRSLDAPRDEPALLVLLFTSLGCWIPFLFFLALSLCGIEVETKTRDMFMSEKCFKHTTRDTNIVFKQLHTSIDFHKEPPPHK